MKAIMLVARKRVRYTVLKESEEKCARLENRRGIYNAKAKLKYSHPTKGGAEETADGGD